MKRVAEKTNTVAKNAIAYIVVYFLVVNIFVLHHKGRWFSARLQVFLRVFDEDVATVGRMGDKGGWRDVDLSHFVFLKHELP